MVANVASEFHSAKLQLASHGANAPGAPGEGGFSNWIYENWRGAYDLAALAQSVDLICLMTYDQHTRWTAPGPVAGWAWTTGNLDYALSSCPGEALAGIPLYGYHWFAGTPVKAPAQPGSPPTDKPNPSAEYIATRTTRWISQGLMEPRGMGFGRPFFVVFFYRDDLREWIFFTDAHNLRERYSLVKDRSLQGFCSWVLGRKTLPSGSFAFAQMSARSARFVVAALICKYGGLPSSLLVVWGRSTLPLRQFVSKFIFTVDRILIVQPKERHGKAFQNRARQGKLGILLPGMGAVSTTFMAGVELVRKGKSQPVGSLTQMGTIRLGKRTDARSPLIKKFVPLAELSDLTFALGYFQDNAYQSAANAGLESAGPGKGEAVSFHHQAHEGRVRPRFVKLIDGPNIKKGKNKYELALQIKKTSLIFAKLRALRGW